MTEQEKKELLDELEKRMDEKYKGFLIREDVATTLKVPREKWFRDENGEILRCFFLRISLYYYSL